MRKTVLAFVLGLVTVAFLVTGTAFAQTAQTPSPGNAFGAAPGMAGGLLHEYMVKAMASALGISVDQFEARRAAGETAYQIALSQGITADKIADLLGQARIAAVDAAVSDGAITQAQADWMKSRGAGSGLGTCDGTGLQSRNGMMGRGFRWQRTNP